MSATHEPTADPAPRAPRPTPTALIDESECIGCTLCIQACPFDAIVGAARFMHTVVEPLCTGCELCLPPCPVDCISMVARAADRPWTAERTRAAGGRVKARKARLERERLALEQRLASREREDREPADQQFGEERGAVERIAAIVARAVQRARARRSGTGG